MNTTPIPTFVGPEGLRLLKEKKRYVVLDYETTILPGFATNPEQRIVLACWYMVEDGEVVAKRHKFGDEYEQGQLEKDIAWADFVVCHNAKFEAQWMQRSGIDLRNVLFFCTMVGEWVLVGNQKIPLNLDDVALRRLNERKGQLGSKMIREWNVCPSITPRSWLLRYCYQDVDLTYKIFLQQHEELTEKNLWHIALLRNLLIPVLADIELAGLQLDKERVYEEYDKQVAIREEAAKALDAITGGINLNSPKQLTELLYDDLGFMEVKDGRGNYIRTPKGDRSASDGVISKLQPDTERQREFLEKYKNYNKANTLLTKTLNFFKKVCDHNDGVFYGSLVQGRTGTHRLASGGVEVLFPGDKDPMKLQLQNIPREYKRLFTAHDPDYLIREDDGAQLEFRVAAELGNEPVALQEIEDGVDIHSFTRQVMREGKHPDFDGLDDKAARQEAKSHTFQPLYGGRGKHEAENAYADFWANKYKNLVETQENWCLEVAQTKKLVSPYGLIFYWPDVRLYPSGRINKRTEVFNYCIQGFATAEIIPIALVHYWHRIKGLRVQLFNTVHDSIISRVHKDDNKYMEDIAKQSLTYDVYKFLNEVYNYEMHVPLGVGSKTSTHWGEGDEEIVIDVWVDGRERRQVK